MESIYWILIIILFASAFIGLVYPIIPSTFVLLAGFLLYGMLFTFKYFTWYFWVVQCLFVLLLIGSDYIANSIGVKKYGGSKAGVWGSTIGILVGPFVIPFVGIIIGPFIGAIAAEFLFHRRSFSECIKIGIGSVIGFISGVFAKAIVQALMVGFFFFTVVH